MHAINDEIFQGVGKNENLACTELTEQRRFNEI